jgi:hypothetical protein
VLTHQPSLRRGFQSRRETVDQAEATARVCSISAATRSRGEFDRLVAGACFREAGTQQLRGRFGNPGLRPEPDLSASATPLLIRR